MIKKIKRLIRKRKAIKRIARKKRIYREPLYVHELKK